MIQTTIRIPKELHQKLKELAKKKGLTVNALIVQALWKLQEVIDMPEKQFMGAKDIAQTMECSLSFAYKIIKQMNAELKEKGYITMSGKVPTKYFNERFYSQKGVIKLIGAINSYRDLRDICRKHSGSCRDCP